MSSVHFVDTVTDITNMDISEVSIYGIENIPENCIGSTPLLAPRPDDFITDLTFTRESMGAGEMMNIEYVLHWQYLHAPMGSNNDLFETYNGMIENLAKIIEGISEITSLTGGVDLVIDGIEKIAVIKDITGNEFHGVELSIRVTEFINL